MSKGEVKISSRMLTEILAGTFDYRAASESKEELMQGFVHMKHYFQAQLRAGRTIDEISVAKRPDEDDDWIEIKYNRADAAVSKFK